MDDKRQYSRIETDFSAELTTDGAAEVPVYAELLDCSFGGIQVRAVAVPRVRYRVRVRIVDLRMAKDVVDLGIAEIVHVQPDHAAGSAFVNRMGLKFIAPDAEAVQRLYHAAHVKQTVRKHAAERASAKGKKVWA